jgi:hypothetical protein
MAWHLLAAVGPGYRADQDPGFAPRVDAVLDAMGWRPPPGTDPAGADDSARGIDQDRAVQVGHVGHPEE